MFEWIQAWLIFSVLVDWFSLVCESQALLRPAVVCDLYLRDGEARPSRSSPRLVATFLAIFARP